MRFYTLLVWAVASVAFAPLTASAVAHMKIEVSCGGNQGKAETTIRWGHPNHDDNEYFHGWTVKTAENMQTKTFDLNDNSSELEIQTEGGGATSYSIKIYRDDKLVMTITHINGHDSAILDGNIGATKTGGINKYGECSYRIYLDQEMHGPAH